MVQADQINDQLQRGKIASPISGTILAKYAEAGEITMAGRALFKVADTKNMHLKAYITSDLLTRLKLNQIVKVYADFGEEESREYSGEVIWISDKAEFTPKTIQTKDERVKLVFAVKVMIENSDMTLKPGMPADAEIIISGSAK